MPKATGVGIQTSKMANYYRNSHNESTAGVASSSKDGIELSSSNDFV